jgi:hypothetical protein
MSGAPQTLKLPLTGGCNCGAVRYEVSAPLESIGIRMGTFDDDPGVRPSVRQFVAYAAIWEPLPDDGLPRFAESRHAATVPPL